MEERRRKSRRSDEGNEGENFNKHKKPKEVQMEITQCIIKVLETEMEGLKEEMRKRENGQGKMKIRKEEAGEQDKWIRRKIDE